MVLFQGNVFVSVRPSPSGGRYWGIVRCTCSQIYMLRSLSAVRLATKKRLNCVSSFINIALTGFCFSYASPARCSRPERQLSAAQQVGHPSGSDHGAPENRNPTAPSVTRGALSVEYDYVFPNSKLTSQNERVCVSPSWDSFQHSA